MIRRPPISPLFPSTPLFRSPSSAKTTTIIPASRIDNSAERSAPLTSGLYHRLNLNPVTTPLTTGRSEEHTSELQSHLNLVCRLLLEKKKTHLTSRISDPSLT